MNQYWTPTLQKRISRRRALAGSGMTAAAAAFLAACGGSSKGSNNSLPKDTSGLLTKPVQSDAQAKQGGTWPHYITAEVNTMDPLNNASTGNAINNQAWAYSRFFMWKPGVLENPIGGDFVLDASQSWEQSPDGLTFTFKLRPDVKFDPRPPTNGRLLTTADVKWSWDRYAAGGLTRADYLNSLNPSSPVTGMQVTDKQTVVFKMAFPVANMASRFAFHRNFSFLPMEADTGFNPKIDQRGSGPWMLRKWEPSVSYTYDRNPNWHVTKGAPYFDTVTLPLLTEYAAQLAQLTSGHIWTIVVNATDIVATKNLQPKLNMYANQYPWGAQNHLSFGWGPNNPWGDARVRRAVALLIDRDAWIDTFYNASAFEKQGLPMDTRWNSHYFADDKRYWIDPKPADSKLGEGGQYFKLNPTMATQLMKAAGYNQPLKTSGLVMGNNTATAQALALRNMLQDSGLFDMAINTLTANDYNVKIFNNMGVFDGLALQMNHGVRGDIDQYLSTRFSPGGASGTQSIMPQVYPWYQKTQDLISAQRKELDDKKRLTILEDLQKEMAVQMPTVPFPGAANGFTLAWPQLANLNVYATQADNESTLYPHYWFDASKAPA